MSYRVVVSDDAESDLYEIIDYIFVQENDLAPGLTVLERLERAVSSLTTNPQRGRYVPCLRRTGVKRFRELIEKPWRIVYSIHGHVVHVVAIVDGRRNADDLLRERRLRDIYET